MGGNVTDKGKVRNSLKPITTQCQRRMRNLAGR